MTRDGTSQSERALPALDPSYAQVDERTTADFLAFTRAYSTELKFFGVDDADSALGTWSEFVDANDVRDAERYLREPEAFSAAAAAPYARPHFALFLTFLKLLGDAQQRINSLTRRHLEFYYRDVLKMVRKRQVADQVHVLVELENRTSQLLLPAGTALQAGQDSAGKDLVYRTNRDLLANRVQVARISGLHSEIRITGIREASTQSKVDGTRDDAFVAMMRIALGQPTPGDPLPMDLKATPPVYPGVPPANNPAADVNYAAMQAADALVRSVDTALGIPMFDDFRSLMRLKAIRAAKDATDWAAINAILLRAGGGKAKPFANATDFQANLRAALNMTVQDFAHVYDGLPEVKSIEEVYATVNARDDVRAFVESTLLLSVPDFMSMMQTKVIMDNQWAEINRLLEQAGRRKRSDATFKLPLEDPTLPRDFNAKFTAAIVSTPAAPFSFPGGLDAFYQAFLSVERYFYMSAENFSYVMSVAQSGSTPETNQWDWDKVYEIVGDAHREMIYARRRAALRIIAQPDPRVAIANNSKALEDMLEVVNGERLDIDDALERIDGLGVTADDGTYLQDVANGVPNADWDRVVTILETAQRNRENFKAPVAEKVEWRNVYPAADATKVLAESTQPEPETLPRWETFGRGERKRAQDPVPAAVFGWAVASPLLALAEGGRTIELTLGLSSDPHTFDLTRILALLAPTPSAQTVAGFNPFQVQISTATGWLDLDTTISWSGPNMDGYPKIKGVDPASLRALVFTSVIINGQPATASLTRDVHGIDTTVPVLRLMMKPVWNDDDSSYVTSYQALRNVRLLRTRLAVTATGLTSLFIANDQSTLDAKKPFEPFGSTPAPGSRFFVGHPEVVGKKLDSLNVTISWMGAPPNLTTQYKNYPGALGNASFTARVSLADGRLLKDFGTPLGLFDPDATKPVTRALQPPVDQGIPVLPATVPPDVTSWDRYHVWELNAPDFQHSTYPTVAIQKSLELSTAMSSATKPTASDYQVNPPYTPKIKRLSLDYTSSVELAMDPASVAASTTRVFHVHPFGYCALSPEGVPPSCLLLPQFDFEGELYIGLAQVSAPQNVSLLLQMAEGSANPDVVPAPVKWSYLSGNEWLTLHDGSLISDGTRGLINSGIVELSLKPVLPNQLLPSDLYWIRAAIVRSSDGVCDMVAVHPNAVLATFDDNDNAPDHLQHPLPPAQITGPVAPTPGVSAVKQPYTSFGGKTAERDESFYVRVSERLRHKQRALTMWDYERLVLEKFPQIYKVKCLTADVIADPPDPGRIDVVVVPNIRNRFPFKPFEPKAPADLIRDVESFLSDKTPPSARMTVKNAHFVPVQVRCGVRFIPGQDDGFCRRRLNDELNRFLSPWAYEEGADLVIGGSVYANSLINFIDRRDYVDYVAELKLFTSEDEGQTFKFVQEAEGYHASTDRPDGVLVAAREHVFDVISHADYRIEGLAGINYMKIELDFVVA